MYDDDSDPSTPNIARDVKLNGDGEFVSYWVIFNENMLEIGTYTLDVTDSTDETHAQCVFEIVPKTVDIEPRKPIFRIGETVAFDVESSFI